jgi:hypothetical protein
VDDEQVPARRSNVGGKAPSMRPPGANRETAIELPDNDASSSANGDEEETLDMINQAANGNFGQSLSSSTLMGNDNIDAGGPVRRANGASKSRATASTAERLQLEKARQEMEQANRMAKLRALEMFEDEGGFGL